MLKNIVSRVLVTSVFILLIAVSPTIINSTARAEASATVDNWWPVNGATVDGQQPFKGLVEGMQLNQYYMFWQVDNGQYNLMTDNQTDYPHKEADIDLSGWNWESNGVYHINFIAQDLSGHEIGRTSFAITVNHGTVTNTSINTSSTQSSTPSSTSPTPTTPTIVAPTPAPAPAPTPAPAPVTTNTTVTNSTNKLFVDPSNPALTQAAQWQSSQPVNAALMQKLGSQSTAVWFGGWNSNVQSDVAHLISQATAQNAIPTLVAYNIPGRDCGGYSAGGATDAASYATWISQFSAGLGNGKAIVILEPDSLAGIDCLSSSQQTDRYNMLNNALSIFKVNNPNAKVYLDAGHSGWDDVNTITQRLKNAGVSKAAGFSLNVSNFVTTSDNTSYGQNVSQALGGTHFVIDTSRNGNGSDGEWCNPPGRAVGQTPTLSTGNSVIDAYLWVKVPGESDGNCNGGPNAGVWWPSYAVDLAKNAGW